jgi:DNA-binding response OmpR family regulator
MLIEDDQTMLSLLTTILSMEGYQVVEWREQDEPLGKIMEASPDLAMIDVHLKDKNGIDLVKQIRQKPELSELRVLMSSGMDYRVTCIENGADDFILKPYMPDELMEKVSNLLDD